MSRSIYAILGGLITMVLGLALFGTLTTFAISAATTTGIGSFPSLPGLIGIVPLIFVIGLIIGGVGLMIGGAAGLAGKGPMARA